MTTTLLAIALIATAVAHAVAIYFVCKLVEKVSKLNAANSVLEYRTLDSEMKTTGKTPSEQPGDVEHSSDGTLEGEGLEELRKRL